MEKENEGNKGVPPGEELSREQVMAQRAEKKKLKEARKNKSAQGGGGDGGDKPKQEKKEKKPQQQQQQQKKGGGGADKAKGEQGTKQQATPQVQGGGDVAKEGKDSKHQNQQQKQQQKAKEVPEKAKEASPPKVKETTPQPVVAVVEGVDAEVKGETPERNISVTKGGSEFQSRIQSLFQVKKLELSKNLKNLEIHPLFHNLGVKLKHDVIRGTNNRCIALLKVVKEYVEGYQTPVGHSFKHALSADLKQNMDLLRTRCPLAIGMNNAVEFLSAFLYKMDVAGDVATQKEDIFSEIEQYIEDKIEKAVEAIVIYGVDKIVTGDVIMIYSVTEAVISLLEKAAHFEEAEDKKTFELILIQTPETLAELPVLLKKLSEPVRRRDIIISSVIFPNAIYRMRHCTKLIIGGHGLFTTGGVMAQSGAAELALLASTYNKPTIFLCETYKFCDRSPLDFFTLDEYMPEQSVTEEGLFQPKIRYDVTPANLVTVVITDIDLLPSTSVPVVLRVQEGRVPMKTEETGVEP